MDKGIKILIAITLFLFVIFGRLDRGYMAFGGENLAFFGYIGWLIGSYIYDKKRF